MSEYSDIRQLYNIVFPYIVEHTGANLALLWEEIGKSNFRELTPYLVRAITNEVNQSQNVERAFTAMVEDISSTNETADVEMSDGEVRHQVVEQLLEVGHLTNRQLRARIRPERPTSFTVHVVDYQHNGNQRKILVSLMDESQYALLQRRLGRSVQIREAQMSELAHSHFGRMINEAS